MSDVHVEGATLDWIAFYFSAQVSNFVLDLCVLGLIEAPKKGKEEIELQIELHPKVI